MNTSRIILFTSIIIILLSILKSNIAFSSGVSITTQWVVYSNISDNDDYAYATCSFGSYVYVTGSTGYNFYVEAIDKDTGRIIYIWSPGYGEELYDCVIINGDIYAVGYEWTWLGSYEWAIIRLDYSLNLIDSVYEDVSSDEDIAYAVATDGSYLYIAGVDKSPGDAQWRIEKRSLPGLDLIKVYTVNPSSSNDYVYDIKINPADGKIWVIGFNGNKWKPHVEILDKNLNKIKSFDIDISGVGGRAYSIVFDTNGYAYIVSEYATIKYSKDGYMVSLNSYIGGYKAILYNDLLYIFNYEYDDITGYFIHYISVLDANKLTSIATVVLSTDVNGDSYFDIGDAFLDKDKNVIYVAGYNDAPGSDQWVIYSLSIKTPEETVTTREEIVKISTTTITTTKTQTTSLIKTKYHTLTTTKFSTKSYTTTKTSIVSTTTTTTKILNKTLTTTSTKEVTKIDWGITSLVSIIVAIIGISIGMFIRKH